MAVDGKSSGDGKQLLRFEESPGHCINRPRASLRPNLTPFPRRAMGMTENLRTKNIHVAILTGSETALHPLRHRPTSNHVLGSGWKLPLPESKLLPNWE